MTTHRYVVFADRILGFDDLEAARVFALANVPAVLCERVRTSDGRSQLREIVRHDFLYDEATSSWRVMMG